MPYPSETHDSPQMKLPTKHTHLGESDGVCNKDRKIGRSRNYSNSRKRINKELQSNLGQNSQKPAGDLSKPVFKYEISRS